MASKTPEIAEMLKDVTTDRLVAGSVKLLLHWRDERLFSTTLLFADKGEGPEFASPRGAAFQAALERAVAGQEPDWPETELAMEDLTAFSKDVLDTLKGRVGRGQTVSYGELSAMAGRPGAARAVGRVMASNRWPLLVPCHRVLGANGALTGFSGSGLPMKTYLLEAEGALPPTA